MLPSPETNLRIAELPEGPRKTAEDLARSIRAQLAALGAYGEGGTPEEQKPDVDRVLERIFSNAASRTASLAAMSTLTRDLTQLTEFLTPKSDLTKLRVVLQNEHAADGSSLESKLDEVNGERTLDAHLTRAIRSYADGKMAFTPDLSKLSFDLTPEKLAQLKEGLTPMRDAEGRELPPALTGLLLTAYPQEAALPRLVLALNAQEVQRMEEARTAGKTYVPTTFPHTVESLKAMPVTEFLARHFEARGGTLYDRDDRIEKWSELRWEPNSTERAAGRTTLSAVYVAAANHKAAHDALAPQATLGQVLGTSALSFAHARQEIATETKILQKSGAALAQGSGLTFTKLMQTGATLPSPVEWLTLLGQCSSPSDATTYPTPYGFAGKENSWEWLAGITASRAAGAYSDSDGARLYWDDPSSSDSDGRARSALRSAPGL